MKRLVHPFLIACCITLLHPLYSCSKNMPGVNGGTYTGGDNPPATTGKSYLALGDSYTIGQSVSTADRFPAQTATWLSSKGFTIQEPQYIATTGWTTINLLSAIQSINPTGPYDIVTLLIGVNDQYVHLDTAGYRQRFTQLLQKSIDLAGKKTTHVFVLSIPDYSVTPFAADLDRSQISKEIDWFNAINKQVTLQYNISYLDITPSTREAAGNPALVANDGLHPSGAEYKKWADRLGSMIAPVLK